MERFTRAYCLALLALVLMFALVTLLGGGLMGCALYRTDAGPWRTGSDIDVERQCVDMPAVRGGLNSAQFESMGCCWNDGGREAPGCCSGAGWISGPHGCERTDLESSARVPGR